MSAETDNSRSSRRPRPEVHIYRPGSGPLKKSGSNADNIMSGTSSHSTTTSESGHDLASSLRAVTLNSESVEGDRAKSLTGEGDGKGSRSKKNQGRRQEKSENKSHKGDTQNQPSGNEQRSKSSEHSSTYTANKQPANLPLPPPDKTAVAANTNQDLRQLLLEKRMQRNKQSPAGSNRDSSSDMPRRDSNTINSRQPGKPDKNEAPSSQPPKPDEKLKNGHASDSNQSSNSIRRNDTEQPGLSRNSEGRGSTGKRRKDRKNPQRVETSRSEGHLSALATNSAPASQSIPSLEVKSGDVDERKELSESNANGKDRHEGSGHNSKKKRNRGSRRGSTSSETASTPVPESSWTDEHLHLRPVKEQEATRQPQSNPSLAKESSTHGRHVSSPIESRNRNEHHQISTVRQDQPRTVSPSAFHRPTHVISHSHSSSGGPQRQNAHSFQHHQPVSGHVANHRNVERHSSYPTNDSRPPTGRNGGRDRPPNLDSLPPRFRKKYEEEHGLLPTPPAESLLSSSTKVENTWDGASMTFLSAVGVAPIQSRPPPPFPPKHQPTPMPSSTGRAAQWSNSRAGSGRITSGGNEDVDVNSPVRPRSQDSASGTGGYSDHSVRERKTSFNDSRSSTPSSSLDIGTSQQQLRGALRRLEEVSHTQTSLDWSEEMEEEDRRSQVGESRQQQQRPVKQQNAPASLPPDIKFTCSDVRYLNKPMKGYSVILSNGMDPNPPAVPTSVPPPLIADHPVGRPILGQGRKQEQPKPLRNSEPHPTAVSNRMSVPGLIQLPHGPPAHQPEHSRHSPRRADGPSSSRHQHDNRSNQDSANRPNSYRKVNSQRTLFDPSNPHKPIVVPHRDDNAVSHAHQRTTSPLLACPEQFYQSPPVDSQSGSSSKPSWYDPHSESFRSSKSDPHLLMDLMRSDMELSWLIHGTGIIQRFARIQGNRSFFLNSLRLMLTNDLRFCEAENVEQHVWKVAFHNVIEALRKSIADESTEDKEEYRRFLFTVIDDGSTYFESLLETLQQAHNFSLERYLEPQPYPILSGLGYVGLAVISCQKMLIFLGDLARYREMTADTSNYGKAKSWYTKANLANPKNGRPYNQLAILALYARRKLDAVYLYMRSLMASNPFQSARESLVSLFDENRKKYEQQERKRREAKEASSNRRREAAAATSDAARIDGRGLRREIWIHPLDGRRTRRTTSTSGSTEAANALNSDDEELAQLPSIEVNKRFVTSYLNVQGKLYTKIGMETFQECGRQMLREFRALLQQTPLPVNATRLLQLLALNMFAVSNTQLKDTRMAGGYRSAWQECALIVSLEMFNILLERCNAVLKEQLESGRLSSFGEDLQIILPAVKVWCDWLLCHSMVWNPPPTSRDYHVGPAGTPWTRLATLINLLGKLDTSQVEITNQQLEGYEAVKLPEDVTLCGFTPLMLNSYEAHYTPRSSDMEAAADRVRIERLLYFGRDFLCGLDPPVLKLKFIGPSLSEYVSVVDGSGGINSVNHQTGHHVPKEDDSDDEDDVEGLLLNELERDEEVVDDAAASAGSSSLAATGTDAVEDDMNRLRQRKDELTQKHLDRERRKQQLRAILLERVQVELEVRPKYLVADTNCYIDHLDAVVRLTREKHYTLIAPLVVLNELEGLCRSRLAAESRAALAFLRDKNPQVRYVTSKGAPLPTLLAAGTVNEENDDQALTNDDRILQCCLGLIKDKPGSAEDEHSQDGVRRLRRDVVLLTDDRNLRVKALTRDVPVRDLPAFLTWAASAAAVAH